MFSFRGMKDLFISSSKSGNSVFNFVLISLVFLVLSLVIGFILSFPIYYIGTEYVHFYKHFVSLGLAFFILIYFVYRSYRNYNDEEMSLTVIPISEKEKKLVQLLYSIPLLLPRWLKTISYLVFAIIFIAFILFILGFLIFGLLSLLIDSIAWIKAGFAFVQKIEYLFLNILFNDPQEERTLDNLSSSFYWALLIIFELMVLITLFDSKSILESRLARLSKENKHQSLFKPFSLTITWILLIQAQIVLLYLYLFAMIFIKLLEILF